MSITDKIRDAGIVGAGGAGFPTHVKMNATAECVIANGAECEPLLRVDQQVMDVYAKDVVQGMRIAMQATKAKKGVIALKDHYKKAIAALEKEIKPQDSISLHIMRSYYPAGDEQQIVYEVMGKVVPTGGLPLDVGAVVSNVSTLANIAQAERGVAVTEKFVTVGGAVKHPVTLKVPVGASMSELLEKAGGVTEESDFIIGGPCMGQVVVDLNRPVTKTTGGILAIPKGHKLFFMKDGELNLQAMQSVCCQCSMCTQMCPRNALGLNVEPHKAMRSIAQGMPLLENANGLFSCCDCGVCTYYACNFGLQPHKVMSMMKAGLTGQGAKAKKEVYGPVDQSIDYKRMPVSRLIARMGISEYDVPAPLDATLLDVSVVRIPLKMHVGAPSVPVIKKGQKVSKGQLIADIPEKALGAKIHASIDGTVTEIGQDFIEIRK